MDIFWTPGGSRAAPHTVWWLLFSVSGDNYRPRRARSAPRLGPSCPLRGKRQTAVSSDHPRPRCRPRASPHLRLEGKKLKCCKQNEGLQLLPDLTTSAPRQSQPQARRHSGPSHPDFCVFQTRAHSCKPSARYWFVRFPFAQVAAWGHYHLAVCCFPVVMLVICLRPHVTCHT